VNKVIQISVVSLAFLCVSSGSLHAEENVCIPEAAKMTAEAAAGLNAMSLLCGKATTLEVDSSRRQLAIEGPRGYPCAKESFIKWYDARFNEARHESSLASKSQKQQVCAGLEQVKAMSEEILKGLQSAVKK
jgi:hypothetical protein